MMETERHKRIKLEIMKANMYTFGIDKLDTDKLVNYLAKVEKRIESLESTRKKK